MKYTEGMIQRLLSERYKAPEWAYFAHVPDSTGSMATRIADGVAMNLYPFQGFKLTCFEIKVSRSDLMSELKDITKSECVGKFCDYFVLVIPKGIVLAKELPNHWGLMEVDGESLYTTRKPKQNESIAPFTRGFIASVLRRGSENGEETPIMRSLDQERQKLEHERHVYENARKRLDEMAGLREKEMNEKRELLEEREKMFAEASGLFIRSYEGNRHVPALLRAASSKKIFDKIAELRDLLKYITEPVEDIASEYTAIRHECETRRRAESMTTRQSEATAR